MDIIDGWGYMTTTQEKEQLSHLPLHDWKGICGRCFQWCLPKFLTGWLRLYSWGSLSQLHN